MGEPSASHVMPPAQRDKNSSSTVTSVRLFDVTTDSQSHVLPREWIGRYVNIRAETATVDYFLTPHSGQTVDRTVAATAAGASGVTLGGRLDAGSSDDVIVPEFGGAPDIYLVREGTATGALRITLRT